MKTNLRSLVPLHASFLPVFLWLLAAACPQPAQGAARFWAGTSSGLFSLGANWVGGVAPVAGDDLVFQAGVTRLLVTNDFSPNRAWTSILFQGSNYFVRGNPILVTNGINSLNPSGTNTIDAHVEVRSSQPWEAQGALAYIDVNGDINLNANTLTIRANTADFFFGGIISGTGNIVKTNVGTLRMNGSGHNTYSGFTRMDGGVLELAKFSLIPASNYVSIPGDLTIGDGNNLPGTDVCRLLSDDQIGNTSHVTVKNSGLFDLNDFDDHIGPLSFQGGTMDSGTGVLFLGGDLNTLTDANSATINGRLSLGGASRTFDISSGPPAADLQINASISSDTVLFASAGFTKTGSGSLFLAGTNTYNGITTVNEGQLSLLTDRALGATIGPLGASAGTAISAMGNLFISNVQVTNEALTITSTNIGGAFNASGAAVWTGDILLSADTFIASAGTFLLNGTITGSGGFTKLNVGSLTLAGTNANSYTGTTFVRDGLLLLHKDTPALNDHALSGPLVIGEDELPENDDVVRLLACCQMPDDTDVTINASGLFDLNSFGQNVRNIVLNGGDITTAAAGSILPLGNITVNRNTNSQAIITGRLSVLSNPVIDVTGHYYSPDLQINALVFGAGGFTKNGVGEVGLTAANTYSGLTTVDDGFLILGNSSALGTTANGTVVRSGAVLSLNLGIAVPAEALTLAGEGQSGFGALHSSFGSNSWAGNITLSSNATITVDVGDFLNLSGSINGAFDITKQDTGTLLFSGNTASSFDEMRVDAGTLVLDKTVANVTGFAELRIGDGSGTDVVRLLRDNQIADTTPVHIELSGRLAMNDRVDTTGSIDGRGVIDLGSGTLREGTDNGTETFTGLILGTGSIFKLGTGAWTLVANNTYTGPTTASAGTLAVNGSQPQSPVTVNGTATLTGEGTVGNLHGFGNVQPGNGPGILTCSNLAFEASAHLFLELNGSVPGTGHDQLNVRGTNQLGNATLHLTAGAGFVPVEGERLTILNNDGSEAIQGTFNGLPNGSLISVGGLQLRILYSDIFLNDVQLVVTNTAIKLGGDPLVETGNGNGEIDPGECNLLRIALMNKIGGIVSGITATLSSTHAGVTITQPNSTYPNLPANGMRTNDTPFQISTAPALLCGTNIDLLLTVHTATNGSFSIPLQMITGAAGSPARSNQNVDSAIADIATVDSTINIAGFAGVLARVTVSLHLTHTAVGDLSLSLIGPDGTTIHLSSNNGGTGDNFGIGETDAERTVFSDLGLASITNALPPYQGTFRPEQRLSGFRGKFGSGVNGNWVLRMNDNAGGSLGTLRAWSLFLSPTVCAPGGGVCDPPCPGCPVTLAISRDPGNTNNVLLQWSTAILGYNLVATNALQAGPNAVAPAGPAPVVVGSKFTVTNAATGTARFYELRKP